MFIPILNQRWSGGLVINPPQGLGTCLRGKNNVFYLSLSTQHVLLIKLLRSVGVVWHLQLQEAAEKRLLLAVDIGSITGFCRKTISIKNNQYILHGFF